MPKYDDICVIGSIGTKVHEVPQAYGWSLTRMIVCLLVSNCRAMAEIASSKTASYAGTICISPDRAIKLRTSTPKKTCCVWSQLIHPCHGPTLTCSGNTISQKKSSEIPSELSPWKRQRNLHTKTGAAKVWKIQHIHINIEIPVGLRVPLFRWTH